MKLISDYTVEKLAGNDVLMPAGQAVLDGRNVFYLNDSAKWYLEQLKEDKSFEELLALAEKKYKAETLDDKETLRNDLEIFLNQLRSRNLLS